LYHFGPSHFLHTGTFYYLNYHSEFGLYIFWGIIALLGVDHLIFGEGPGRWTYGQIFFSWPSSWPDFFPQELAWTTFFSWIFRWPDFFHRPRPKNQNSQPLRTLLALIALQKKWDLFQNWIGVEKLFLLTLWDLFSGFFWISLLAEKKKRLDILWTIF
jgi:hypothetical protein